MSRLRSPTSASTSTTRAPVRASAAPTLAVVVVLPTPPLPEVTTIARPRVRADRGRGGRGFCRAARARSACLSSEEAAEEPGASKRRERDELAFEPARDLLVDRRQARLGVEDDRLAAVGRVDDLLVVGDDPEQLGGEDLAHVVDREHVARAHHLGPHAVDDQPQRQPAFVELADHAVGVADRADLGRGDDDRFARAGDRVAKAVLDAGRAVDDDVVAQLGQIVDHLGELVLAHRRLVARLRRRQDRERFAEALVADQRLAQLAAAFDDLDDDRRRSASRARARGRGCAARCRRRPARRAGRAARAPRRDWRWSSSSRRRLSPT